MHFGEIECGRIGDPARRSSARPRAEPGDPPYPEVMNGAVIDEMRALDPDAVLVKGDLTDAGRESEFEAFLAAYGSLGAHAMGARQPRRHDRPAFRRRDAPFPVHVDGVTLAVVDTVVPGSDRGRCSADQVAWLDELAGSVTHPCSCSGTTTCGTSTPTTVRARTSGSTPTTARRWRRVVGRREHRRLLRRPHAPQPRAALPGAQRAVRRGGLHEGLPGAWAEYRVYEGGYTQVVRRAPAPAAMAWTEKTRACSPACTATTRSARSATAASPSASEPMAAGEIAGAP